MNSTLSLEVAADAATDNAIVVLPSSGTAEVNWMILGGSSTLVIWMPLRNARIASP